MCGVERLVCHAFRIGAWCQVRLRVHRRAPLSAVERHILHAGFQVLGTVVCQPDALVFLGIGQARVNGQQQARIMSSRIKRVGIALLPGVLKRE